MPPDTLDISDSANGRRVLVGGVGYRWQRDASIGLIAADKIAEDGGLPAGVEVMDLGYGAIYAARDIDAPDTPYDRLILMAGTERGRTPGEIYEWQWDGALPGEVEIQERVREAGAGVIHVDHLLVIGEYFGMLPNDVLVIEVEPQDASGGENMSPVGEAMLPRLIERALHAAECATDSERRVRQ